MSASAQKMREMQADFAQKIGQLMKQKEELEKEVLKVGVLSEGLTWRYKLY